MYIQWNITLPSNNEILPFAAPQMDLENIILGKVR